MEDFDRCKRYSCGSVMLAWTSTSLSNATKSDTTDLGGCVPLIMSYICLVLSRFRLHPRLSCFVIFQRARVPQHHHCCNATSIASLLVLFRCVVAALFLFLTADFDSILLHFCYSSSHSCLREE
ncbi:hypothetical protein PIB30_032636 [Stylosanthes scabra]|uniref:Uncharacterized protein n=1 Tax=Stylosanthes scabra TaxID=79078 RepID=A0ABU6VE93_9FABA|nr:hypothetical protein [Stylosanthes scabra]